MSTRPNKNSAGNSRKQTMPMYGLVCNPNKSARKIIRKRTAPIVARATPSSDIGFRNHRTDTRMLRSPPLACALANRRVHNQHEQHQPEAEADRADHV